MRQRIEAVLDYATALGPRTGDNQLAGRDTRQPARQALKGPSGRASCSAGLAGSPAFMAQFAGERGFAARALAFADPDRCPFWRGARYDLGRDRRASSWTVPAFGQGRKEHRVPLDPGGKALLGERGSPSGACVPKSDRSRTVRFRTDPDRRAQAHETLRHHRAWLPVHLPRLGWRNDGSPSRVIEAALAHRLKDKAEAAYARGDLFTKRRKLMEDWAAFAGKGESAALRLQFGPTDQSNPTASPDKSK